MNCHYKINNERFKIMIFGRGRVPIHADFMISIYKSEVIQKVEITLEYKRMRIQISKQHLASIICKLVAHMYLKRYSIFDNNHHNKTFNIQGRKELISSIYTFSCSMSVLLLLKMMKTLLMISSMMMCMLVGMMMIRMCSNVISRMR